LAGPSREEPAKAQRAAGDGRGGRPGRAAVARGDDGFVEQPKGRKARRAAKRLAAADTPSAPKREAAGGGPPGGERDDPDDQLMGDVADIQLVSDGELAEHTRTAEKLGPFGAAQLAAFKAEAQRRIDLKKEKRTFPQRQRHLLNLQQKAEKDLDAKRKEREAAASALEVAKNALVEADLAVCKATEAHDAAVRAVCDLAAAQAPPAHGHPHQLFGNLDPDLRTAPEVAQALDFASPIIRTAISLAQQRQRRAAEVGTAALPGLATTFAEERIAADGREYQRQISALMDATSAKFTQLATGVTTNLARMAAEQATHVAAVVPVPLDAADGHAAPGGASAAADGAALPGGDGAPAPFVPGAVAHGEFDAPVPPPQSV